MDRKGFQDWLDRYVEAWKTYEREKIAALFSDDAEYRYHPQDEPIRGRGAIVDSWLAPDADAFGVARDEPGTYDAHYEPLAIDPPVHVASGWTRYFDAPGGNLTDEYRNVFICRFNEAGECTEYTEYWIQGREFRRRDRERLLRESRSGGEA